MYEVVYEMSTIIEIYISSTDDDECCVIVGGKTAHVGLLMKNRGKLIALDKSRSKIPRLRQNIEKSGLTNTHIYRYDSVQAVSDGNSNSLILCLMPQYGK